MQTRHIKMTMAKLDDRDLAHRVAAFAPATVLTIGPGAGELLTDYLRAHRECRVAHLDSDGTCEQSALLGALSGQVRFDFVIVRGVLEHMDADIGAHLLARLRDVHCRRFCVLLEAERNDDQGHGHWEAAELAAMGLSHWSSEPIADTLYDVYGFDLGTYKRTPEWLNARHWAHPEHWGKYRW